MMMQTESTLMKLFRFLGSDSIAWSLRRLHIPVSKNDLVLEVGSGSNPYYRSNVLLDAFEVTQERHWTPLIKDRPTVLGFVENLPFRDQSFDFIIASHVLEHSTRPEEFISELMRVGKAGYIEVPHAFAERCSSYYDHRLEILAEDGSLKIWKKSDWLVDKQLRRFFLNDPVRVLSPHLISKKPFHFHVRFYWEKSINYEILNPEVNTGWESPVSLTHWSYNDLNFIGKAKTNTLKIVRSLCSQRSRNKKIDLVALIRCPNCHSDLPMKKDVDRVTCMSCNVQFNYTGNFINLINKIN